MREAGANAEADTKEARMAMNLNMVKGVGVRFVGSLLLRLSIEILKLRS